MKRSLSLIFIFFGLLTFAQKPTKYTISGYVSDAKSGEALIGVKIFVPSINKGTISNNYGFYSLTLEEDTYQIQFRSALFPTEIKEVQLTKDIDYNLDFIAAKITHAMTTSTE